MLRIYRFQSWRNYSNLTTRLAAITTKFIMSLLEMILDGEDNNHSFQPPEINPVDHVKYVFTWRMRSIWFSLTILSFLLLLWALPNMVSNLKFKNHGRGFSSGTWWRLEKKILKHCCMWCNTSTWVTTRQWHTLE